MIATFAELLTSEREDRRSRLDNIARIAHLINARPGYDVFSISTLAGDARFYPALKNCLKLAQGNTPNVKQLKKTCVYVRFCRDRIRLSFHPRWKREFGLNLKNWSPGMQRPLPVGIKLGIGDWRLVNGKW